MEEVLGSISKNCRKHFLLWLFWQKTNIRWHSNLPIYQEYRGRWPRTGAWGTFGLRWEGWEDTTVKYNQEWKKFQMSSQQSLKNMRKLSNIYWLKFWSWVPTPVAMRCVGDWLLGNNSKLLWKSLTGEIFL